MASRPMLPVRRRFCVALLGTTIVLAACGTTSHTPSATPSTTSQASISAGPSASSGASATPLPSVELPGRADPVAVGEHLAELEAIAEAHDGVRTAGTPGYEASVDYVVGQMQSLGYRVETPAFEMATFRELPGGTVTLPDGGPTFVSGDDFHAMIYSASGDVTAKVATVGFPDSAGGAGDQGCSADDWEAFPAGAIALTPAGPCFRRDGVEHALDAGAVALVVTYPEWEPGHARRPTLLFPDGIDIPVLSAIDEVGDALIEAADAGTDVRIAVDTQIGSATVRNVIAEVGEGGPVVMLGGHLDSVHDGPGIDDNGSGVAGLLEVARLVADADPPTTVRFAFWAGEEFGLLGSRDYVSSLSDDQRGAISAYLNLDMLGSVNGVPIVYRDSAAASGSSLISDFLVGWLEADGIGAESQDLGGGSDHFFFQEAGIRTGGLFSGASELKTRSQAEEFGGERGEPMDPCYHLACDTVANVDLEQVATLADAALAAALLLARGELTPEP